MTRRVHFNIGVTLAMLLTLAALLPSCSNDDSNSPDLPENKLYTLTINLQPTSSYIPVTKAASSDWAEEEDAYERKIKECWVAVFDASGNWKTTVSTNDFSINNGHQDSESSATVKLPIGNYTLFAFANLNSLSTEDATIIKELESGKQKNGTATLTKQYLTDRAVSLSDRSSFNLTSGKEIPMSSYAIDTEVKENVDNKAEIWLFRMLGKVTITIDNQTGNDITLKELSIGKFRNGAIYLTPYKEGNLTLNDLPGTDIQNQLQPKFPSATTDGYTENISIPEGGEVITSTAKQKSYMFYAFETGSETNNNDELDLSIKINERNLSTKKIDYSFIRRNDWIKIPIVVSNVQSTIKFLNRRMPIGGLPPQVVFGQDNGVQILVDAINTIDPTYAGAIDIELSLNSINQVADPSILYTSTIAEGAARSSALLLDNSNSLLIDENTGSALANEKTFKVEPSPSDMNNKAKCYFRVWTQELGNPSKATIKLTILAEYGTENPKRRIEIPYTIIIQNFNTSTNR